MVAKVQILRTSTPNQAPVANSLQPGELAVEMASNPSKLWVGVPSSIEPSGMKLLAPSSGGYTKPESDAKYVELAGDTMTGPLLINDPNVAWIGLGGGAVGQGIWGYSGAANVPTNERWSMFLGDANSNFSIGRFDDNGAPVPADGSATLTINRATGNTMLSGNLDINAVSPQLWFIKQTEAEFAGICAAAQGILRWDIALAGDDGNSNFAIRRYDNAGVRAVEVPLTIERASGDTIIGGALNAVSTRPWIQVARTNPTAEMGLWAYDGVMTDPTTARWGLAFTAGAAADFNIQRFSDAGAFLSIPLSINRATGMVTVSNSLTAIGNIMVTKPGDNPGLTLDKDAADPNLMAGVWGSRGGLPRWAVILGYAGAETGNGTGSDFAILRYADDGGGGIAITPHALSISRSTGETTLHHIAHITPQNGWIPLAASALSIAYGTISASCGISMRPDLDGLWPMIFENNAGATVGNIQTTASATFYNTSSDANLKEDLKSFDAGNIIDDTQVYDFAWKSTGERAYGIIAQQAVDVYPQAVTHMAVPDKDEWWGIDYSKYVPVLLQELKALRERVRNLEQAAGLKPPVIDPKAR